MVDTATATFKAFTKNQQQPSYMLTEAFLTALDLLQKQKLSEWELELIEKLRYSRQIYTSLEGHQMRIKLMKQQLMDELLPT